jgi:hypothetical protein
MWWCRLFGDRPIDTFLSIPSSVKEYGKQMRNEYCLHEDETKFCLNYKKKHIELNQR